MLSEMYGGNYSANFSLKLFSNLDLDMFYSTVTNILIKTKDNEVNSKDFRLHKYSFDTDESPSNNFYILLLETISITISCGLLYSLNIVK